MECGAHRGGAAAWRWREVVRDYAGYNGSGMKKGVSSCVWRVKRLHGVEQAWQQ
jgi:hypothetical protein